MPTMSEDGQRPRVPTVRKTAELLELFTPEKPVWRLRELAKRLGWGEATAHRFVTAMAEVDLLTITADGAYTIGLLPARLGAVYLGSEPRRQSLVAQIEKIAHETGLTTQLGVLDGRAVTVIASREGSNAINAAAELGQRLPLHASALGKVILSQVETDDVLPAQLERLTGRTKTDRQLILDEVQAVRAGGLASASSEMADGLHAIATPIPAGYFDDRPSGLACAGPDPALVPGRWQRAGELLEELRLRLERDVSLLGRTAAGQ